MGTLEEIIVGVVVRLSYRTVYHGAIMRGYLLLWMLLAIKGGDQILSAL